ncbi:MAG: hypothetical protein LBG50_01000 [Clostridiales Family XIII bacterium]|jgi:hypothetical protein|nr:hypothetical protein [Clostridiales Family XIII bacterium]
MSEKPSSVFFSNLGFRSNRRFIMIAAPLRGGRAWLACCAGYCISLGRGGFWRNSSWHHYRLGCRRFGIIAIPFILGRGAGRGYRRLAHGVWRRFDTRLQPFVRSGAMHRRHGLCVCSKTHLGKQVGREIIHAGALIYAVIAIIQKIGKALPIFDFVIGLIHFAYLNASLV